jgi:ADP-ribose pyrophosphatase
MLSFVGRFLPKLGPCFARPNFLAMRGPGLDEDSIAIRERRTAYSGFFRIDKFHLRHRLFAGGWSPELSREVFLRHNAAGILLYDPIRDELVLVEQFRLAAHLAGFAAWQIEIVAGIIETGESTAEVARREAQEEAGLPVIGDLVPIHRFLTSPGGSTETVDLFCGRVDATNAGGIHGLADESEDIRVAVMSTAAALALVAEGRIENGFTLLALHWFAANRETLRLAWR